MIRKKQLVIVSHCILNQNSVLPNWERAQGGFNNIVRQLIDQDYGIIQLPCPEFKHKGLDRPPMTKEQYDTVSYRRLCAQLSKDVVMDLMAYIQNGYEMVGLLGIESSPSCDTKKNPGVFMEELMEACRDQGIALSSIDIPENYLEGASAFPILF